jgi:putative membrane protein
MIQGARGFGPGTWAIVGLAGLVLVLALAWLIGGPAGLAGCCGMMGWGMMPAMLVGMVLVWVAVIVGLVALVRWLAGVTQARGPDTPLGIAQRRYAAGEITREEYERLRADVARNGPSG